MKKAIFPGLTISLIFLYLLSAEATAQFERSPYLQVVTSNSIVVRWNTTDSITGVVRYGSSTDLLTFSASESQPNTFHEVTISGLLPATRYYYSINDLPGTSGQYFVTAGNYGDKRKKRIWVISDFGQTSVSQNEARELTVTKWKSFNQGSLHTDFILSLGDQTENDTQEELQQTFFNPLSDVFLNTPLFTVEGNHDAHDDLVNYKASFSVPSNAEAGGFPSNSKDFYSFEFENIHIIVLSTEVDDINKTQHIWLENDLKNIDTTKSDWLIACLHRPFHSGGDHNTDLSSTAQKQRDYWLTKLEDYGVDLILQGHNHIYERSFLIDNLIGPTSELTEENILNGGDGREDGDGAYIKRSGIKPHNGTVFLEVAPGGVAVSTISEFPVFSFSFAGSDKEGSVVVDVDSRDKMNVFFLCNASGPDSSPVWDYFTIIKSDSLAITSKIKQYRAKTPGITNYPNPFDYSTKIVYNLPHADKVRIEICDILGRKISVLNEGYKDEGIHEIEWNEWGDNNSYLPAGIYIATIFTSDIRKNVMMMRR
jgi:predicted phosphodiesterase